MVLLPTEPKLKNTVRTKNTHKESDSMVRVGTDSRVYDDVLLSALEAIDRADFDVKAGR